MLNKFKTWLYKRRTASAQQRILEMINDSEICIEPRIGSEKTEWTCYPWDSKEKDRTIVEQTPLAAFVALTHITGPDYACAFWGEIEKYQISLLYNYNWFHKGWWYCCSHKIGRDYMSRESAKDALQTVLWFCTTK